MIIGTGNFSGRNGYKLEGSFTLTLQPSGKLLFETSDDFFFGNSTGGGTPAPGFAFFAGDPTDLPSDIVGDAAIDTDFLRIADQTISVSGKQTGEIPASINLNDFDTLFLWCFEVPFVLGVGPITRGEQNGN